MCLLSLSRSITTFTGRGNASRRYRGIHTESRGLCGSIRGDEMSDIEILYNLPSDVMLISGKLMRNPEADDGHPEWIQCAARTSRGKRCLNTLDINPVTEWWGSVKLDGHEFQVRTEDKREFTPERLNRWKNQLCELHYQMRDRIAYNVPPQWTSYDPADDIAKMDRISRLVK